MFKIAIDGPGGAGKSTISKEVAKKLGFIYVDTGAMYRACALNAIENGVDIKNNPDLAADLTDKIAIDIDYKEDGQHIYLNGVDVSFKIRTPEVSMGASDISAIKRVRERLVSLQRKLSESKNVVMDGRDIGTHVLPDAQVKIFLTASDRVRAKRRYDELCEKGVSVSFESVLEEMIIRDRNDSTRAISPLKPADDSVILDTSDMDFSEALSRVLAIVKEKIGSEEIL